MRSIMSLVVICGISLALSGCGESPGTRAVSGGLLGGRCRSCRGRRNWRKRWNRRPCGCWSGCSRRGVDSTAALLVPKQRAAGSSNRPFMRATAEEGATQHVRSHAGSATSLDWLPGRKARNTLPSDVKITAWAGVTDPRRRPSINHAKPEQSGRAGGTER